jgi:hypothetical protein
LVIQVAAATWIIAKALIAYLELQVWSEHPGPELACGDIRLVLLLIHQVKCHATGFDAGHQ